jgi:hypothetical protein
MAEDSRVSHHEFYHDRVYRLFPLAVTTVKSQELGREL